MPFELLRIQMLLPAFGLVLARVGGLVLAVPMFSSRQLPAAVKVWLVATISLMAFPVVFPHLPTELTAAQAVTGMVGELCIGFLLGFAASVVFYGAQIGGKIVSHQSGMALGSVFNPIFEDESTALDQVWFFTALAIFLLVRGHVAVVMVLLSSFRHVPPLLADFDGGAGELMLVMIRDMFELALRLAGPAVLTLLLTSLLMGFLTKTMPQLNVLSVGFSVKIAAAMFVAAVTIGFAEDMLTETIERSLNEAGVFFEQSAAVILRGVAHGR